MVYLHALFLFIIFGSYFFFLYLDILNFNYGDEMVHKEKDWLNEKFDIDDIGELLNYQRLKTGFSQLKTGIGTALVIGLLYTNIPNRIVSTIETLHGNEIIQGIIFFGGLTILGMMFSLPFSAFQTFVIEENYDFNEQTIRLWMLDKLKGLFIGLTFTVVIAGAILWFIQILPGLWWLAGWLMIVLFGLLMQVIYPRIIAPLFNNFEPIEEETLRGAIEDLFDRAGFTCSDIYQMDASRRSSHSNAYFVGFGRTKRVVLFDTLVDQMEVEQVQGVLAHELAHWKKGHVWESILHNAIRMFFLFGGLYLLMNTSWLYGMFGLPEVSYLGLILGSLWISPLSEFLSPLENKRSINNEREADEFAVDTLEDGQNLVNALYRLVGENLSNPFPHPLYASFYYTHPPIPDRIRHIREFDDEISNTSD